ncbi:unnamed protein product [Adineta steineri]|uniref:Secreted protein n=1 Tax=Adineta steineri TaxID=433720 RepID=A0A814PZ12_9BILA|nr:unnamed protein product [Adineta steineri]
MTVTTCDKMFFYRVASFVLLISCFIAFIQAEKHLNANGPFGKRHTVHNEPSPYACDRGAESIEETKKQQENSEMIENGDSQVSPPIEDSQICQIDEDPQDQCQVVECID